MMSSTLLEKTRSTHEQVERLERLVVEELRKTEPMSRMERLVEGDRVRNMVESIILKSKKLIETYEDKHGRMEAEIAKLGETDLFYDRLKEIREYHRNLHPPDHFVDASEDYIALVVAKEEEEEREMDHKAHHAKSESGHKLPMRWDRKPIPHCLESLRGLHNEFKCEICGNRRYKGRRSFEMHFKEEQHQRGMRLLGIPSTNGFKITTIDQAQELWRRIKERQRVCIWRPELEA